MKTGSSLERAMTLAAQARTLMSEGASLEKALSIVCQTVTPEEKAACQSLTYTSTRHFMACETLMRLLAKRAPAKDVKSLLLVAFAELIENPDKAYVIVNEAVKAVKNVAPAASGFANACLRRLTRERTKLMSIASSSDEVCLNAPRWWIEKMRATLGESQADAMMRLARSRPPMILRVNRRKNTPQEWIASARDKGIEARLLGDEAVLLSEAMPVSDVPGFAEGLVSVQDAGAQLAAQFAQPKSGETILDACAAPGGKTAHLLELADCRVTALEIDAVRARRIHENLTRLGLNAEVKTADAAKPDTWWDKALYDTILLDAPCTASGIVRRHPDIVFSRRPQDIRALALQQKKLLETLWPLLKVGGKLVYVVCSVFEEEGKAQIEAFLAKHSDAKAISPKPGIPSLLTLTPCESSEKEYPGIYDTHDGFFYAVLLKN